jgi:ketosteroid isomerase-like protein
MNSRGVRLAPMNSTRLAGSLLLGLMMAGCASISNVDAGKESLLRVDREWAAAASEGKDLDRIVSFWSDDATVFPAGAPVVQGKASIRNFVKQSLAIPGFHITWRSDHVALSADGTMGYITGENATTIPGPDGKLMTIAGRGVSVWRRGPGGEWKCVIDIWNSGP